MSTDGGRLPILAAFAAIYLVWGSTFLAIRWAVETIPPFPMMTVRCLIGGAILLVMARTLDASAGWPTRGQWAGSALVGAFFFVGCHGLLAREERFVPSSLAALCLATIPLFVPLLAWKLTDAGAPTARMGIALLAAFAGVALLVAAQGANGALAPFDALLLLFTAFSWAAGTVASRIVPVPGSALMAAAAALLSGSLMLAVISLGSGQWSDLHVSEISAKSAAGLAYMVVFGTVVTFASYMWLLGRVAPSRVATYAFVNPAVAVLLGWSLAGEELSPGTLAATGVIIVAVAVAVTAPARRPAVSPEVASVRVEPG